MQARQFRALGLSATGDDLLPGLANLRRQFEQLSERVVGEDVPRKLRDRLGRVGAVLSGQFGKVTDETKEAIIDLFEQIRGTFSNEANKGLPEIRHVELSDEIARALGFDVTVGRNRGSLDININPPRFQTPTGTAAAGVTVTGPVTVVAENPDVFLRELQKKASRTTATARGRFPGRSLGLG